MRFNESIYSSAPYLEGYGFFGLSGSRRDRIAKITVHPFDNTNIPVREFIKTNVREPDAMFDGVPRLMSAVPFPPSPGERFALKLLFENGTARKYVLPIPEEDGDAQVLQVCGHVFTDRIWQSAAVAEGLSPGYPGYAPRRPAVLFKNGFLIPGLRGWLESVPCQEPENAMSPP